MTNGFQELGDYLQPCCMTGAQAEQIITDVNQRLVAQPRQPLACKHSLAAP